MKKNPGRKDRRALAKRRRCMLSEKKQAINERKMLWQSKRKDKKDENKFLNGKDGS